MAGALLEVRVPTDTDQAAAKVSFVYRDPGESVRAGDALVELLTDKATRNIESPADAVVRETLVAEDDTVVPDQLLMVLTLV